MTYVKPSFSGRSAISFADSIFTLLTLLVVGAHLASAIIDLGKLNASTNIIAGTVLISLGLSTLFIRKSVMAARQLGWPVLIALSCWITMPLWLAGTFGIASAMHWSRWSRRFIFLVLAPSAAFLANWVFVYGLNGNTLFALIQSHPAEAADFVVSNLTLRLVIGLVLMLSTIQVWLQWRNTITLRAAALTPMLALFVVCLQVFPELLPALRDLRQKVESEALAFVAPQASVPANDIDVVFILGESTSRWNFPQYGYSRPTSPNLTANRDQVVWLSDAISTESHTVESVSSLMRRPVQGDVDKVETLLGRLTAAKVATRWYSTQTGVGPWGSPILRLAEQASFRLMFDNSTPNWLLGLDQLFHISKGFTADEEMVSKLSKDLTNTKGGPQFFLGHLTATHWDYCRLIPSAAIAATALWPRGEAFFGNAHDRTRDVNCYDAGILHLDKLISNVVGASERSARSTVVIYAPDHGEDPNGGTGHSASKPSARHVEIPVMIHFNEAARAALPQRWARVQQNKDARFALPWLHETILDLFGILEAHASDSNVAITAPDYAPPRRVTYPGTGAIQYDINDFNDRRDYLSRIRMNMKAMAGSTDRPRKVLAHRVNSELALLEAKQQFEGVEMDVVLNETTGHFDVYHPPATPSGLDLRRALEVVASHPKLEFWLDWKNPSETNMAAALKELKALDQLHGIKARSVVEISPAYSGEASKLIGAAGFRMSLYLAPSADLERACTEATNSSTCSQGVAFSVQKFHRSGAACISHDIKLRHFADAVAAVIKPSCQLTWDTTLDAAASDFTVRLAKLKRFDTVIVNFPSHYLR